MKIVTGTNDKKTINPNHFGESRYFCVYEMLMGKESSVDCRENPFAGEHVPGKPQKIMELLNDCDVFIIRSIGRHAFTVLPSQNKTLYLTRLTEIEDVISKLSAGELKYFQKFNPASGKFEMHDPD